MAKASPPIERLMARSLRTADGCLVWQGHTTDRGYGQIGVGHKIVFTHRLAYESAHGPVPDGFELDHLCRNRACVDVAHLELVTHAENLRRKPKPATCKKGHPWTPENRMARSDGSSECRPCTLAARESYRRRRGQAKKEPYVVLKAGAGLTTAHGTRGRVLGMCWLADGTWWVAVVGQAPQRTDSEGQAVQLLTDGAKAS